MDFVYLLIGLAAGGVIGWLLGQRRAAPADGRVENELRQQLAQREGELAQARDQAAQASSARAAAEAAKFAADHSAADLKQRSLAAEETARQAQQALRAEIAEVTGQLNGALRQLAEARAQFDAGQQSLAQLRGDQTASAVATVQVQKENLGLQRRNGELEAQVKSLGETLAAERLQVGQLNEKFHKEFEAAANKLLVENSSRFTQQSSESLGKLLTPLREHLTEFRTKLEATQQETATHSALLKEQISRIGTDAANLTKALKGDVKVLGNWGENMLDLILEKSGLQQDVHYRRQQGAKDDEGRQRILDVIVELPERGSMVIDSKVSLKAYEGSVNEADEPTRAALLDQHVEALRKHFRELGHKRYQDLHGISTPDFVLMYVPIEGAFFAAISREPNLFREALDQNVVLITNSTLLATLRTVAQVWRLADQQKHALEIAKRGGLLYDKFVGFVEDLQGVGKALAVAHDKWSEASDKLVEGGGNLVGQAQKLKDLGVKATKSLPATLVEKAVLPELETAVQPPAVV